MLEDDAELRPSFGAEWAELWGRVRLDPRWDVLYLGFSDDTKLYSNSGDAELFVASGQCVFCGRTRGICASTNPSFVDSHL